MTVNVRFGTCLFLFIVMGFALSEAVTAQASLRAEMTSGAAITEAKQVFDDKLLDYPSTRFRDVRFVRVRDAFDALCGQINTTNRMGGYTGWKAFLLPVGAEAASSVYDKPTIEGEPTSMDSFMQRYGSKPIEGNSAARVIAGACGSDAVRLDQVDHAAALTFRP